MTHEEIRPLLPAYAAGALDEIASEPIRAHLASGCADCLREVFALPVGLPRETSRSVMPPVRRAGGSDRWGLVAAVVALSLALAVAVGWMVAELGARERSARAEAERSGSRAAATESRLAAAESARAGVAARLDAIERQLADAEQRAAREAETARGAAEENARLESDLAVANERAATLQRGLQRRDTEIERLRSGAVSRGLDSDPLASPDAELLPMAPIAPFRDVRGHAVWNRGSDAGVVYAFHLPPLAPGASYRLRVVLDDDRELSGRPFRADGSGEVVIAFPTDTTRGTRPRAVRILLEPGGRPVLGWERRPPPN